MDPKEIGVKGEVLAIEFLKKKGHSILATNWRFGHKEIDIISFFQNTIYIVEVKTRSSEYIAPKDAVTKKKQKNLIYAANEYVIRNGLDSEVQFDIIEVILKGEEVKIHHIESAFSPQL